MRHCSIDLTGKKTHLILNKVKKYMIYDNFTASLCDIWLLWSYLGGHFEYVDLLPPNCYLHLTNRLQFAKLNKWCTYWGQKLPNFQFSVLFSALLCRFWCYGWPFWIVDYIIYIYRRWKNFLPMLVATFSLYGGLNHVTFLVRFLLLLLPCLFRGSCFNL